MPKNYIFFRKPVLYPISRESRELVLQEALDALANALLEVEARRNTRKQGVHLLVDSFALLALEMFRSKSCRKACDLQSDNSQEPTIRWIDFPSWLSKTVVTATSSIASRDIFWNFCLKDQKAIMRNFDGSQDWAFLI